MSQRRVLDGVGNEVDAYLATLALIAGAAEVCNAVDGQAYAIDSDRAFVGQVFTDAGWGLDTQLPAFTNLREMRDEADAIHMARNDVAAKPVIGTQGFFKIDRTELCQAAGFVQRFG